MKDNTNKNFKYFAITIFTVFIALCLFLIYFKNIKWYVKLIFVLCSVIFIIIHFILKNKIFFNKIFLIADIALLIFLTGYILLDHFSILDTFNSVESLKNFLLSDNVKNYSILVFFLLQFLQVVILPIPAIITTLAGTALFGAKVTFLISSIAIILASMLAFFLGRTFGYKFVAWLIGEDTLIKYQNYMKSKEKVMVSVMFLFPFFPDDLICMIAGLGKMSYFSFFVITLFIRPISILCTTYSFELTKFIPLTEWWGIVIWGFIIAAMAVIFILFWKNSDRIEKSLVKLVTREKNKSDNE